MVMEKNQRGMKDLHLKQPSYGNSRDEEGRFDFVSDLTDTEIRCLILYLTGVTRDDIYIKLYGILGREVIPFISLFQGSTIKIPRIKYLLKSKHYCRLYEYVRVNGDTEDTRRRAAETFKKRVSHVDSVMSKVGKELNKVMGDRCVSPKLKGFRNEIGRIKNGTKRKRDL